MAEFQQNLWAPWRMEYIESLHARTPGCFLCQYAEHPAADERNLVVWRGPRTLVLLNRFPYSNGHALVTPLRHVAGLDGLTPDELLELICRVRDVQQALTQALGAQGFNIGFNMGACAGAGLPDHVHAHVVPRWAGDVNYMAVLADVKVMPQALERTMTALREASAALGLPATAE
jgi:ATP adenylyltransferase